MVVLYLEYSTFSSSLSRDGISLSDAEDSLDETMSGTTISSFSPVEHKSFISLRENLVLFLSCVKRTIVSK